MLELIFRFYSVTITFWFYSLREKRNVYFIHRVVIILD